MIVSYLLKALIKEASAKRRASPQLLQAKRKNKLNIRLRKTS